MAKLLISSIIFRAVKESKPVVGSSKNSIGGLVTNSTPIDVLLRSPPDTPLIIDPPILVFAQLYIPNFFIISSTISFLYSKGSFKEISALYCIASLGVKDSIRISSCGTNPMILLKLSLSIV